MTEAEELLREARDELYVIASYKDDPNTNSGLRMTAKQYAFLIAKIDAYLSRPADGVVVPMEPTFEQWQKGSLCLKAHNDTPHMESSVRKAVAIAVYKAMLSAAPSVKGGGE